MDVLRLEQFNRAKDNVDIIGETRTIYWPVAIYRIMLPSNKNENMGDRLNSFEKVVLKLIDALGKTVSEKEISELTCLEEATVRFIILKLQDRGFIDSKLNIKENDRNLLNNSFTNNIDFKPAIIFRELHAGNFFPFIYLYETFEAFKKDEVNQSIRKIPMNKELASDITPEEVIKVYKSMKKHKNDFGDKCSVPNLNQIGIEKTIEYYYLPCEIVIQKSNIDYRILNPFQKGYSRILEMAFENLLITDDNSKNWLNKWYENLANTASYSKEDYSDKDDYLIKFWKNHKCKDYYGQLIQNLTPNYGRQYRDIKKIYASIEWALYYYCKHNDFDKTIDELELIQSNELNQILSERAIKLGFEVERNVDNKTEKIFFSQVSIEKLERIKKNNSSPDYDSLIAIALLLENNTNLRELAKNIPYFLWSMKKIKESRGEELHRKKSFSNDDIKLSDDSLMQGVVQTLLPEIDFPDELKSESCSKKKKQIIDSNIIAKSNIISYFSNLLHKMSDSLKDRLFNAEAFYVMAGSNNEASIFVSHLYAALQITLSLKIIDLNTSNEVKRGNYHLLAENKLIKVGFSSLPKNLKTVSAKGIRDSLTGKDFSLGASFIAFVLLSDGDTLANIFAFSKDFISSISEIIELRGHGNTELNLSKSKIETLRKNVYLIIQTIMEA